MRPYHRESKHHRKHIHDRPGQNYIYETENDRSAQRPLETKIFSALSKDGWQYDMKNRASKLEDKEAVKAIKAIDTGAIPLFDQIDERRTRVDVCFKTMKERLKKALRCALKATDESVNIKMENEHRSPIMKIMKGGTTLLELVREDTNDCKSFEARCTTIDDPVDVTVVTKKARDAQYPKGTQRMETKKRNRQIVVDSDDDEEEKERQRKEAKEKKEKDTDFGMKGETSITEIKRFHGVEDSLQKDSDPDATSGSDDGDDYSDESGSDGAGDAFEGDDARADDGRVDHLIKAEVTKEKRATGLVPKKRKKQKKQSQQGASSGIQQFPTNASVQMVPAPAAVDLGIPMSEQREVRVSVQPPTGYAVGSSSAFKVRFDVMWLSNAFGTQTTLEPKIGCFVGVDSILDEICFQLWSQEPMLLWIPSALTRNGQRFDRGESIELPYCPANNGIKLGGRCEDVNADVSRFNERVLANPVIAEV
jgi:hypothetical protein